MRRLFAKDIAPSIVLGAIIPGQSGGVEVMLMQCNLTSVGNTIHVQPEIWKHSVSVPTTADRSMIDVSVLFAGTNNGTPFWVSTNPKPHDPVQGVLDGKRVVIHTSEHKGVVVPHRVGGPAIVFEGDVRHPDNRWYRNGYPQTPNAHERMAWNERIQSPNTDTTKNKPKPIRLYTLER